MANLWVDFICVTCVILMLHQASVKAAPVESLPEADDLSTADSIGVGYYAPTYYGPYYGGGGYGYKYGGGYGYGYGGYRGYGRYYRRPIYPVWG